MTDRNDNPPDEPATVRVNPGYASLQIAKALTTSEVHEDAATRERAKEKISKWETVLTNILTGSLDYGSRTPVESVPVWATLEVVTGGFATGQLLAAGPLQEHEQELLQTLSADQPPEPRRALNAYFLSEAGLADLSRKLQTGCYDVALPEEGALLVVTWLVENEYREEARELISELSPHFARLRFYPIPLQQPRRFGSRVSLQDVGSTINDLQKIKPNHHILAQKEAIEVWAPWYDRMVALFLETVVDGWPCRQYPSAWATRAIGLLDEYVELRKTHQLCGKPERRQGHFAQLRAFLDQCARHPASLSGQQVGRIRLILNRYIEKRGEPNSPACKKARERQAVYVQGPTFHQIAGVAVSRLERYPRNDGLDDVEPLKQPITDEEEGASGVPAGSAVPISIQQKVERCLYDTVDVLVERGLITSGETLARVLPQMISGLRAAGISDPALRQLYGAVYRAFRRRRSLLLLNLEKQVQIEELPWIATIDRFRTDNLSASELSRQALDEITSLTLTSFPHAILPNKLLQELRALIKGAKLNIPLVDEMAADIFMGRFSGKFLESAKRAGNLLDGSLYARYYGIDYSAVQKIPQPQETVKPMWSLSRKPVEAEPFAELCAARAGVELGSWNTAENGMIIEQQQIITTQNLAALFLGLGLTDALHDQLKEMARHCFAWICRRQQIKIANWHARLVMVKNTAYAWRQMIFFLSLIPEGELSLFIDWAQADLEQQPEPFRNRFQPTLQGLRSAAEGRAVAQQFLGWSNSPHLA